MMAKGSGAAVRPRLAGNVLTTAGVEQQQQQQQ
jgi:hypothetical protein